MGTVPVLSIVCMVVAALIAFALPIVGFILMRKKYQADIAPFFIGWLIFFIFVLIFENILHVVVLKFSGNMGKIITDHIWLYGIYGGLAAGIFEETGRYFAFKVLLKKKQKKVNALMYGVGHGGFEAIILVGFGNISNIVASVMINSGAMEGILKTSGLDTDSISTLIDTPSLTFLLGGVERIIAFSLHIALSILVYKAVTEAGKKYFYLLAVGIHAAVDCMSVIVASKIPTVVFEIILAVTVAVIVYYASRVYKGLKDDRLVPEDFQNTESLA